MDNTYRDDDGNRCPRCLMRPEHCECSPILSPVQRACKLARPHKRKARVKWFKVRR